MAMKVGKVATKPVAEPTQDSATDKTADKTGSTSITQGSSSPKK